MTVNELFDCFSAYFYRIVYFDETNNIEDSVKNINETKYNIFIEKYGEFTVLEWQFDNYYNNITIDIKERRRSINEIFNKRNCIN